MVWVVSIGILLFLGLLFPAFGRVTLLIGGIVLLVVGGGIFLIISSSNQTQLQYEQQQKAGATLISTSQLEFSGMQLSNQYGYPNLSGEVKNDSSYILTGLTMGIKAYDCPTSTITPSCTVIGEDPSLQVGLDVPPGQAREITNTSYTYLNLGDMPKPAGQFLWSYTVTGTEGRQ